MYHKEKFELGLSLIDIGSRFSRAMKPAELRPVIGAFNRLASRAKTNGHHAIVNDALRDRRQARRALVACYKTQGGAA